MPSSIAEWERAEVQRSAGEASRVDASRLLADEGQLERYLHPLADTCHPLEYSHYLLGDVRGKTVLDYGCGGGFNSLVLARRGARVVALDISPDLIAIARRRMVANRIRSGVEFVIGSAHEVPVGDESVDVVFGMAILHHLHLAVASREVKRVLRQGGRAIFREPVRNSPVLQAARKLIPYQEAHVSRFERPLTDRELSGFAVGYSSFRAKAFSLPSTRVLRLLPLVRRYVHVFDRCDAALLQRFPRLKHYAAMRVIELVK